VEDDGEFTITTVAQYKREHPKELRAVNAKTFFSGAHVGMTIEECVAYYDKIAETVFVGDSGLHSGAKYMDFRTLSDPERFITVNFRESDRKIVSVLYWKMGKNETFSLEERRYLTDLSSGQGILKTTYMAMGAQFEVTTAAQDKLDQAN
jgi:hypothetical protein